MKKTLIALAVLGASTGAAYAASSVTLYGVIETGVVVQTADKNHKLNGDFITKKARVSMASGFDSGPRWGIKGVEDLGNGYNIGFILEQGFSSDTGNAANNTQAFSRESFLYLQGDFGKFGIGRTGGLAFAQSNAIRTGWVFGTGYQGSAWNSWSWVAKRMNNVVAYNTPSFGGLSLHAMYSNSGVGNTADDTAKWSKNGHYYGLGAKYVGGPIVSSLIFEAAQNKNEAITGNRNTKYGINFGLEYNLGFITPMFAYQYIWQDEGNKDNQFGLSAAIPVAGGKAMLGAKYLFGKNDGAAAGTQDKHRALSLGAGYAYPLSKRTTLKAFAGYTDATKAWGKIGTNNDGDVVYNGYQFFAGMQHNF